MSGWLRGAGRGTAEAAPEGRGAGHSGFSVFFLMVIR